MGKRKAVGATLITRSKDRSSPSSSIQKGRESKTPGIGSGVLGFVNSLCLAAGNQSVCRGDADYSTQCWRLAGALPHAPSTILGIERPRAGNHVDLLNIDELFWLQSTFLPEVVAHGFYLAAPTVSP